MLDEVNRMGERILLLPQQVAQQIAAGEVVERPASVVKELVENCIDAGSTLITIEVKGGGRELIRITDNGKGIHPEDVSLAFLRHATSKLRTIDDLHHIHSMGFRGEALYSVAAVSHLEMTTKTRELDTGTHILIHGGEIISKDEVGCPDGTSILVRDLFYNVPARLKFMKSDSVETGAISSTVLRMILSHPAVSFKLIVNGKTVYHSHGDGQLLHAIHGVYGQEIATKIMPVHAFSGQLGLDGFLGFPEIARGNRTHETLYINQRYVQSPLLNKAIESAYAQILTVHRFPFYVLNVSIPPEWMDVNVHPNKLTVRFSDDQRMYRAVFEATSQAVLNLAMRPIPWQEPKHTGLTEQCDSVSQAIKMKEQESISFSDTNREVMKTFDVPKTIFESKPESNPSIPIPNHATADEVKTFSLKAALSDLKEHVQTITNGWGLPGETLPATSASDLDVPAMFHASTQMDTVTLMQGTMQEVEEPIPRIVGALLQTYVVVEYNHSVYIIDQHAAHERLLYERYRASLDATEPLSQPMLIPQTLELTYDEKLALDDMHALLESLGFMVEDYGRMSVRILSVPHALGQFPLRSFFGDLLQRSRQPDALMRSDRREALIQMACKHAVKAGDTLDIRETQELMRLISQESLPLTCPHGRPFVMTITKKQLEKQFKRVL